MEDIFTRVGEYLDDSTLEKLYLLGMDMNLEVASRSQHWWYERVLVFSRARIQFSNEHSWKEAYILLKRCLSNTGKGLDNISREEDNPLIIDILLSMGLPCPKHIVPCCVRIGLPKILRAILYDNRIELILNDIIPFVRAIDIEDRTEEFKILLSHPKVTDYPSIMNMLLPRAIQNGRTEIVNILLADKRTIISYNDNDSLCAAIRFRQVDIIRTLLGHERMDLSVGVIQICCALTEGRTVEEVANWIEQVPELIQLTPVMKNMMDRMNNVN